METREFTCHLKHHRSHRPNVTSSGGPLPLSLTLSLYLFLNRLLEWRLRFPRPIQWTGRLVRQLERKQVFDSPRVFPTTPMRNEHPLYDPSCRLRTITSSLVEHSLMEETEGKRFVETGSIRCTSFNKLSLFSSSGSWLGTLTKAKVTIE